MVELKVVISLFVFLAGAFLGSYLITIISRVKNKEKLREGYSHCINCGNRLKIKHIIPIISYLHYKGKCPFCKSEIGISTLLWEIGIGILAVTPIYLLNDEWSIYILGGTWGTATLLQLIMRVN